MRLRAFVACSLLAMFFLPVLLAHWTMKQDLRRLKHEIQHQILRGLPKSELLTLRLNTAQQQELKWEHEREFEWKGQMYDVLELHHEQGNLVISCWPDQKESALKLEMRLLWAKVLGSDPIHRHQKEQLLNFLSLLFIDQSEYSVAYPQSERLSLGKLAECGTLNAHSCPPFTPPEH